MNSPVDHHHHSNFKHFCRICSKGFICGRALGGHMRSHGISEETGQGEEEDPGSDWEDKLPASEDATTGVKRMYELRTNPNRLKSCRSCENCGKEFVSWKSFLEHGKCNSDDADSRVSPLCSDEGEDASASNGGGCNWSKRKRSFRAKVDSFNSSEEEDLANCLMMLSNANVDPPPSVDAEDDSWGSPTHDDDHRITPPMFSASPISFRLPPPERSKPPVLTPKGLFECKACKKVFNSHQALGGHRASHKKVKGCFASRLENLDEVGGVHEDDGGQNEEFMGRQHQRSTAVFLQLEQSASLGKGKSKVHECSICHRVFSSGQALGGHKRCHWITSNSAEASSLGKMGNFNQDHVEQVQEKNVFVGKSNDKLDLNLPARGDELGSVRRDPANPLSFEVSTEIYLQSWLEVERKEKHFKRRCSKDEETDNYDNMNNGDGSDFGEEEEDECNKVKLAKLCDLKDVSSNGTSSPWLQVGIGSGSSNANGRHES